MIHNNCRSLTKGFGLFLLILLVLLAGCAKKPDSNPTPNEPSPGNALGLGDHWLSISFGGLERKYLVHVPPSYGKKTPMAVILNFHGGGGNAENEVQQAQMNKKSDSAGFIVVYPEGTGETIAGKSIGTWNAGRCCGYAKENNVDDVGFVSKMLDDLEKKFSIDKKRIFATGLSNGSLFSYRLACELSDKIAAIAPVSAQDSFDNCNPTRKVPVMHFHGTADPAAKYDGGHCGGRTRDPGWDCKSVPDYINEWRVRNGCSEATITIYQQGAATCKQFEGCADGADVVLCTIEGSGHTWPSGQYSGFGEVQVGKISYDISANDEMWKFFQAHPLK